jgi:Protein of unknown function (DUF2958)
MNLLTKADLLTLTRNGQSAAKNPAYDPKPVVKLFTPDANATWLLAWIDSDDADIAFGLCDLGLGFPELGTVRLSEIAAVRGQLGLPVERDRHWTPKHSLSFYAAKAREAERIVA